MRVSDEAVEAAVGVSLRQLGLHGKALPEGLLVARQASIREILEAAAPHMLAAVWDGVAAQVRYDMEINQRVYIANRIRDANPYRPNP